MSKLSKLQGGSKNQSVISRVKLTPLIIGVILQLSIYKVQGFNSICNLQGPAL